MTNINKSFSSGIIYLKYLFVAVFLMTLVVSFVSADGNWGDIGGQGANVTNNSNNVSVVVPPVENNSDGSFVDGNTTVQNFSNSNAARNNGSSSEYTINFYIALGLSIFVLAIVVIFIYFFFVSPKNKWK